jgi:hypothetical protein
VLVAFNDLFLAGFPQTISRVMQISPLRPPVVSHPSSSALSAFRLSLRCAMAETYAALRRPAARRVFPKAAFFVPKRRQNRFLYDTSLVKQWIKLEDGGKTRNDSARHLRSSGFSVVEPIKRMVPFSTAQQGIALGLAPAVAFVQKQVGRLAIELGAAHAPPPPQWRAVSLTPAVYALA